MTPAAIAVARLIVRSWRHGLDRLTGGRAWVVWIMTGGLLTTAVVVWVFSASLASKTFGDVLAHDPALGPAILRSLANNAALVATLMMTMLMVISPSADSLNRLMAMSPISARQGLIGLALPAGTIMLLVTVALYGGPAAATIASGWTASTERLWASILVVATAIYIVLVVTAGLLVIEGTTKRFLRLPRQLARIVAALVMAALASAYTLAEVAMLTSSTPESRLTVSPFNWPMQGLHFAGSERVGWFLLIISAALAISLGAAALGSRQPVQGDMAAMAPLRSTAAQHPAVARSLWWPSAMQLIREPEVMLYLVVFFGGFAALSIAGQFSSLELLGAVGSNLAWVLAGGLALLSYGLTVRTRWVTDSSPVTARRLMTHSDLTITTVVGLTASLLMGLALVATGRFPAVSDVAASVLFGVVVLITMRTAGVVAPYDRDVPLSAIFPLTLSILGSVPVLWGLSRLPAGRPAVALLVVCLLAIGSHHVNVVRVELTRP